MLRALLFLYCLTCSGGLFAQFQIGHTSITFTDPSRNNRPIPTEIYYPADIAGEQVPLATGTFPVISFGHGFVMVWSAYQHFWDTYVPQGYILCFPKTEGTFAPSHTDFAKDLAFLCSAMEAEKTNPSSLFYEHIQPKYCVMGHSMGGGCTVLAHQYNPSLIQCLVTFAAANTNPSAIDVAPEVSVPSLSFAGSYDCITPAAQQALPIYEALDSNACKIYVNVDGASHCQFADANTNCNLGQVLSGCSSPPITAVAQQTLVNNILQPWLKVNLKSISGIWTPLMDTLAAQNGFFSLNTCDNALGLHSAQNNGLEMRILTNPVLDEVLTLQYLSPTTNASIKFRVYSLSSQLLLQLPSRTLAPSELVRISIDGIPSGMHLLVAEDKDGNRGILKFVKY